MSESIKTGQRGIDPLTGAKSYIARGSTQTVSIHPWVVPTEIIRFIYSDVAARIKTKEGRLRVIDPHPYDPKTCQKLYYVDGGNGALAGPFGLLSLKVFLGDYTATHEPVSVYIVQTSPTALKHIQKSSHCATLE